MKTLLLFLIFNYSKTWAKLYLDDKIKFPLDTDLYERVLDHQECNKQLGYIRRNDSLLMSRFLDAGMRVPRGILLGNLVDLGNYYQCLDIHESVKEMSIEGKYCMIKVPVNQNFKIDASFEKFKYNFDPGTLFLHAETIENLALECLQSIYNLFCFSNNQSSLLSNIQFNLALCVPKVCTTEETISGFLFNLTAIGFKYEDVYCRLPNDKPWAPVDYIAIIIFSLLGLLTLLSTSYEVYHNVICKKDPKRVNEILISFSALTNCRRLLDMNPNSDNISCLDGIRALAILWVVVGHVFYVIGHIPANPIYAVKWSQSYESIWITTASLTVDTFFFISGLLLVYITAKKLTGRELVKNLPFFYLNRLLRMFPVLAVVVLYEASLANRVADGPLWHRFMVDSTHKCRQFWWTTLLHLQNFINPEQVCVGVTWYLAIDVQLHILSPIVLFWVLGRSKTLAWSALIVALCASLAASTTYIFTSEPLKETSNYFVYYYVNILTRAPPFFVGLVYGYLLHLWRKRKARIHTILHRFITLFIISLFMLIMYCKFKGDLLDFQNKTLKSLFHSFLRPLWALSLGWIIFVCVNGYGGPINWFLSLNIWKIPARISYALYLIHMTLMMTVYSTSLQPVFFTVGSAMFDAFGFLWLSMFVAFFLTAFVDAPFAILFKKLFECVSKKKPRTNEKPRIAESNQNGTIPQVLHKRENLITKI
ncbi:nose resistant to fluoxetine protein 6-like [Bicyclus anynana]|uniref:Nose resistant to fluoxetine protein 6-like n=1 Tax=Bicyclus anynana TaxID=110368 RepID=A0ABM3LKE6_BICAN|nr:nose resistant to fluoxetine protein 6-like [Bicyclus anynana]